MFFILTNADNYHDIYTHTIIMLNLQFSDYSTDGTQNTPEGLLWFIKYIHLLSDTR